ISPRIIDCGFVVQRAFVWARKLLRNVHLSRVRMAVVIQPGSLVEANDINDQRVALPTPYGVPQPSLTFNRFRLRMLPAIHINLTPDVCTTLEDHDDALEFRLLNNLHRVRSRVQAGTTGRQAIAFWVVLGIILWVVVVDSSCPGVKRGPRFRACAAA